MRRHLLGSLPAMLMTPILLAMFWYFDHENGDTDITWGVFSLMLLFVFIAMISVHDFLPIWRMYAGTSTRRPQDISNQARGVDEQGESIYRSLLELNFHRIGETLTELEVEDGAVPITWFLGNADGTIYAEMVTLHGPAVEFSTVFVDDAVVNTSYPFGDNLIRANLHSSFNTEGVRQAFDQHWQATQAMMQIHGPARPLTTMAQLLEWDWVYRQKYVRIKLFPTIRRGLWNSLELVYFGLWWVVFWLLTWVTGEFSAALLVFLILLLIPLELSLLLNKEDRK